VRGAALWLKYRLEQILDDRRSGTRGTLFNPAAKLHQQLRQVTVGYLYSGAAGFQLFLLGRLPATVIRW
jgi:hypothetical protein